MPTHLLGHLTGRLNKGPLYRAFASKGLPWARDGTFYNNIFAVVKYKKIN